MKHKSKKPGKKTRKQKKKLRKDDAPCKDWDPTY